MVSQKALGTSAAKLRPPPSLALQVRRTGVCNRISSGAARVALLQAPAGFGKTTAMLQLKEQFAAQGIPVSWLTLDGSDNDVGRFLAVLTSAYEQLFVTDTRTAVATGQLALDLINRIADQEVPFVLFLDDFESITNPAVLALVRQLAESLPASARLVIGARSLPDIGLPRLRVRGQLIEIGPADLRFSMPETQEFVRAQRALKLRDEDIDRLYHRTEGWPVALRLASAALECRERPQDFVTRFSGSNAIVSDYLAEEVLARQPQALHRFLLQTSILRELSAPLCNAICDRDDSHDMLAQLEAANLFMIPLDEERRWFRYHSVFATFLRAQLERRDPAQLPSLQRRAAAWYQAQQRPEEAIEYALAAGDLAQALPLLANHAPRLIEENRVRLLTRWFDVIPPARLQAWPRLRLIHAIALAFIRSAIVATAVLDELDSECERVPELAADINALRLNLLVLHDRIEEAQATAVAGLADGLDRRSFAFRMTCDGLAYLAVILGDYAEARHLLDDTRAAQSAHTGSLTLVYADMIEAVIDLLQGRLRQASARCRIAAGAASLGRLQAGGHALAAVLQAIMFYESDELEQAERLLNVYLPLVEELGQPEPLIFGYLTLVRIAAGCGNGSAVQEWLARLEHLGHRNGLARVVASAKLERARLALLQGDLVFANEELERCREAADWPRIDSWSTTANEVDSYVIGRLRWLVHSGAASVALPELKNALARAEGQGRKRRALKLRILLALAQDRSGQQRPAMRSLRVALEQASAEGFVRTFLDEGALLQALLHRYAKTLFADEAQVEKAVELRGYLECLLEKRADTTAPSPITGVVPEAAQYKALTDREMRTLLLLAEGLSNDDIADRLFVSQSTVRTHLRNINSKLEVRSRTQAVAVARRIGLLT